jgi:RNA polymerase sigma-70 factor (ECF subfamily)
METDLDAFCSREWPRLVGALGLYTGDADVAEDLAQETIVRVCLHWNRVRHLNAPGAWAHRVALNLAHSYFRRRQAGRRALQRLAIRVSVDHIDDDTANTVAVRAALAGLPDRQRAALVLRYYVDLPVASVAEILGCPEGTVKTL